MPLSRSLLTLYSNRMYLHFPLWYYLVTSLLLFYSLAKEIRFIWFGFLSYYIFFIVVVVVVVIVVDCARVCLSMGPPFIYFVHVYGFSHRAAIRKEFKPSHKVVPEPREREPTWGCETSFSLCMSFILFIFFSLFSVYYRFASLFSLESDNFRK